MRYSQSMRTLLIALLLCGGAVAAPPFGNEKGHYVLDVDGDKSKDDVWLVTTPARIPEGVEVVFFIPGDNEEPVAGKLSLLVVRRLNGSSRQYLLVANDFFSTPIWGSPDIARQIHADGKRLAVLTESGADMHVLWDGKKFVTIWDGEP